MQVSYFDNGGYVVHKATVAGSDRVFSAWFDEDGRLTGAEGRDRRGATKAVTMRNGLRQWEYLQAKYGYLASYRKGN